MFLRVLEGEIMIAKPDNGKAKLLENWAVEVGFTLKKKLSFYFYKIIVRCYKGGLTVMPCQCLFNCDCWICYTNSGLSTGRKPYQAVYTRGSWAVLASRPVSWAKSVATLSSHMDMIVIMDLWWENGRYLTGQSIKNIFCDTRDIFLTA